MRTPLLLQRTAVATSAAVDSAVAFRVVGAMAKKMRRQSDSNRRVTVLQTVALPLGYAAFSEAIVALFPLRVNEFICVPPIRGKVQHKKLDKQRQMMLIIQHAMN
jgi:hypothetical protein